MLIIKENQNDAAKLAADFLKAGKIIALATDTVYGLACDALNDEAIKKLYSIKKRDNKKPIAILVKNLEAAKKIFYFDFTSEKIAKEFLPGPLTLVLEAKNNSYFSLTSNQNYLGFRIIKTNFIEKLFAEFDGTLALTSANIANEENISLPEEIAEIFKNEDILIIDSGKIENKQASTVAKVCNNKIEILRQGVISKEVLNQV